MAIHALKQAKLSENTTIGKKVLIQDGCSPVGCILTQLIKKWGGFVVVTCHQRSAPVVNALGELKFADLFAILFHLTFNRHV
jgi:reticulon-4-interacting protein 1, mitochondrial